MATSNRKARRAAAVTSAAGKSKVTSAAGKLAFDATRPLVRKAIDFAVAQGTTVAAHAIVQQFVLNTDMCVKRQATPSHARDMLNAINAATAKLDGVKYEAASANRVHEWKVVVSLSSFACLDNLVVRLKEFKSLKFENLYAIAKWMQGSKKVKAGWKSDVVAAPTREILERVVKLSKKRTDKPETKRNPNLAVGMPTTDPKRGALHIVKCAKAWMKANPEANVNDRALVAGIIRNGEKLATEAAPRIVKERAAKAAE